MRLAGVGAGAAEAIAVKRPMTIETVLIWVNMIEGMWVL
jgi:hypothetical protein